MSRVKLPLTIVLSLCIAAPVLSAPEKGGAGKQPSATLVLGTSSTWRYHYALNELVVRTDGQIVPATLKGWNARDAKWLDMPTPLPAVDWMQPDFDDSGWHRIPAVDPNSPWISHLAMRGKFNVTDPTRVKNLKLSLTYRGGVVVYLNGREIARGHLKPGAKPNDLAEDYPEGKLKESRALTDVRIPAALMRRGTNVLAFELHRSPHHASAIVTVRRNTTVDGGTCGLVKVRLTAANADGLVPNVTRPRGLQVWNSGPGTSDFVIDHGDPNDTLKPIRIVAPRGGAASGKVVIGSEKPIKGLRASAGALRSGNGRLSIPASAVQVRYALPGSPESGMNRVFTVSPARFDGLDDVPLEEVPIRTARQTWRGRRIPDEPPITFGAVQPVWITVKVPASAPASEYTGKLTITVPDEKPIVVTVNLRVCPWKVPDPTEYITFVELVQSPETLAMRYEVPFWSPKHWSLIAQSLTLFGQVGNKTCHVPLICETNQGNVESMVRWIRQPDGSFKHDFTIMEKYLDLVVKHQGKPTVVCFYVWDTYLDGGHGGPEKHARQSVKDSRKAHAGKGPLVSLLDEATGKVERHALPMYRNEKSFALWKPVFDEIQRRMKRRGLEKATMIGISTDNRPSKEVIDLFRKVASNVPWVSHGHAMPHELHGVPVGYLSGVWAGGRFAKDPSLGRTYGWQRTFSGLRSKAFSAPGGAVLTHHARSTNNSFGQTTWRFIGEMNTTGQQRGFGRMGGDFFAVLKDRRGRWRGGLSARFPKTSWRNLDIHTSVLAPGKNGPVATARFEMMREGLQEAEARIFIEKALLDKQFRAKLGEDVAVQCQKLLDDRIRNMRRAVATLRAIGGSWTSYTYIGNSWWQASPLVGSLWFVSSDWQQWTTDLYDAAAEVAKAIERK